MSKLTTANPGGNKKTSSRSDLNYWARAKASDYAATHKAKRMKRHAKRMTKKAG